MDKKFNMRNNDTDGKLNKARLRSDDDFLDETYQVQPCTMFVNNKLHDNCFRKVLENEVFEQDSKYIDS